MKMTEKGKNSKKVPNLRFEGFEGEWILNSLRELVDFKTTNSFSRDMLNYEKGIVKNIHYGDIHTKFQTLFNITNEKVPFINNDINIDRISKENYCKEGDVIFADASEDLNDVGKSIEIINLNNEKLLSGLHTLLARPKQDTFAKGFLGYLFKSPNIRLQIQKESQGTKVLSINAGRLSKIRLSYPQIKEQQKIGLFLTLIDNRISESMKTIEELITLKKGLTQKIFSQELRFKDDEGNSFPKWKDVKLETLCEKVKSGGTPRSTIQEYYDGNIPFLSISDMTLQGKNLFFTERNISQKGLDNSTSWLVPVNSIIYSMYASVGFVSINRIELATSQAVLNIIVKSDIDIEYLYYFLDYYRKFIDKYITTGTQGNLNAETVKGFIIPVPIYFEQQKIANFLSSIDEKIEVENQLLQKLEEQKKYFLTNLFV